MGKIVTIWDGEQFVHVDQATAKKLVKQDKAQILNDGFVSGDSLKYRHQFTGYKTRELRAETKPAPAPEPEPEKPKKAKKTDYSTYTVVELRGMMGDRDLKYAGLKKAEMIAALEADDNG